MRWNLFESTRLMNCIKWGWLSCNSSFIFSSTTYKYQNFRGVFTHIQTHAPTHNRTSVGCISFLGCHLFAIKSRLCLICLCLSTCFGVKWENSFRHKSVFARNSIGTSNCLPCKRVNDSPFTGHSTATAITHI